MHSHGNSREEEEQACALFRRRRAPLKPRGRRHGARPVRAIDPSGSIRHCVPRRLSMLSVVCTTTCSPRAEPLPASGKALMHFLFNRQLIHAGLSIATALDSLPLPGRVRFPRTPRCLPRDNRTMFSRRLLILSFQRAAIAAGHFARPIPRLGTRFRRSCPPSRRRQSPVRSPDEAPPPRWHRRIPRHDRGRTPRGCCRRRVVVAGQFTDR